ncbi:MAG: VRR-NUC domain-containing protein [Prevotella sp.]
MPDRLCVLPHGITVFVELKTTGKKPTKLQELCMNELRALGQECIVVDSSVSLTLLLRDLHNRLWTQPEVSAGDIQEAIGNYSGRKDLKL